MIYEMDNEAVPTLSSEAEDATVSSPPAAAPARVMGAIPGAVVMTQRCAAALRAYLAENGLHHYRIYSCNDADALEAEQHLDALGEAGAAWHPLPPLVAGGRDIASLTHDTERGTRAWDAGVLRLRRHDIVLARWYWLDVNDYGALRALRLLAARSPMDVERLRDAVAAQRRTSAAAVWQVIRGYAWKDLPRTPRPAQVDLLLPESLHRAVDADIVRFFTPEVAALYRELGVPHRRGVLLHGPPGNGKTSLIRLIGARLPKVPVLILRPDQEFDTDDLEEVIRRWTEQAPAILVIEDLNWLLEKVNVSTFLNLLDGVDAPAAGGLLLIATTNHPDQLDSAVNNRPGRFDVVIEVAPPDKALRHAFLRCRLPSDILESAVDAVVDRTGGLSFAHLQEILRLSGLHAIHAGRVARGPDDLLRAADAVREMNREAERGFAARPEMPFGLLPLRDAKQR